MKLQDVIQEIISGRIRVATLEEASRCPRCEQPGDNTTEQKIDGGAKGSVIRTYFCRNERCRWHNTSWIVQVKSDGTVPMRGPGDKEFNLLTDSEKAAGYRILEDVLGEDLRDDPAFKL